MAWALSQGPIVRLCLLRRISPPPSPLCWRRWLRGVPRIGRQCVTRSARCSRTSPVGLPADRWRCAFHLTGWSHASLVHDTPEVRLQTWSRWTQSPGSSWRPVGWAGRRPRPAVECMPAEVGVIFHTIFRFSRRSSVFAIAFSSENVALCMSPDSRTLFGDRSSVMPTQSGESPRAKGAAACPEATAG